jgi:RNA polymerase sigma factor (sigma-70 family)
MSTFDFTHEISSLRSTLQMFARKFTFDRDDSLDLVQDTIMKALVYRDKFKDDVNLKRWLYTIMRNTFINSYRKHQRARTSNDTSKELYQLNVEDTHTFSSPDSKYEYEDIWKNINELREELLIPFKMHTSGYKYNEISHHLKIPIGTVKNRIFHARKELQERLQGYSDTM